MTATAANRAVVVGASSGIGRATAELLAQNGFTVLATGRDTTKLAALEAHAATAGSGGRLSVTVADASDTESMARAYASFGTFAHLVLAPSGAHGMGPFVTLAPSELQLGFDGKYWPQIIALQQALPFIERGGSVTLITAGSSGAAYPGTSGLAAINGALDAMVPPLAVELAPTRVNAVSPGVVDTPWWNAIPEASRSAFFAEFAAKAPAGRIGQPLDIADAVRFLIGNSFVTGNILKVDGGARLRV